MFTYTSMYILTEMLACCMIVEDQVILEVPMFNVYLECGCYLGCNRHCYNWAWNLNESLLDLGMAH